MGTSIQERKWFHSQTTRWSVAIGLTLFLVVIAWFPMLRATAKFLIENDTDKSCRVAFVLSGNSIDRGKKAVELFKQGKIKKIVCPGGNLHPLFEAMGFRFLESEVTKKAMIQMGIPDTCIELVPFGTSTREEASLITDYCLKHHLDTAMIISSEFHTRRIHYSLKKGSAGKGIHFWIVGAPDSKIRYWNWWKDENGLIMINNEWIKLLYYYWKY